MTFVAFVAEDVKPSNMECPNDFGAKCRSSSS